MLWIRKCAPSPPAISEKLNFISSSGDRDELEVEVVVVVVVVVVTHKVAKDEVVVV